MVFTSPSWVPPLALDPPDSITIPEFIFSDKYGRYPLNESRPFFVDGTSGKSYSPAEIQQRVDYLARALSSELGWEPNQGTEWDKVAGVFSTNCIDYLPLAWAVHRLGGVFSPANAQYSVPEVVYQLENSGATCIFTCQPLLQQSLEAAAKVGIRKERVFLLDIAGEDKDEKFVTIDQLIKRGSKLSELGALQWSKGEGARRVAFLCYSSGTSGLPKGVMISHRNVIANVMQITTYDEYWRQTLKEPGQRTYVDNALALLPMSHIYSLVVMCHAGPYRGDMSIVLPKFEMQSYLGAIQRFKINSLYLVPPIIILMAKNKNVLEKFDMSSVRIIFTGAAPLGKETAEELQTLYPNWLIRQGYGLTETSTVVCSTSGHDIWFGSSGSVIPSTRVRLVDMNGKDVTEYDTPGELWVDSPSVTLGYLKNDKANAETYVSDSQGRWMRTGDEAMVRKAPSGHEHVFITDRIKELIKVKGLQVAPAELEAHLLKHEYVADCAVIPVPDDAAGEVPKAYVVKSNSVGLEEGDRMVAREIMKHVEREKSRHKWLKGGVEFIDAIPKSASGKILRRMLRDKDREDRRAKGPKL